MTGTLLVAHPNLRDSNFSRTILFLSHHSAEDGAVGLVLNRPLKRKKSSTLSEQTLSALKKVPVYYGGPVGSDEILLASMQWHDAPNAVAFRGFGAIDGEVSIPPEFQPGLRAFVGYAGWSRGQLEDEISQKAWIVLPPTRELIEMPDPKNAWAQVMRELGPIYHLLSVMPDDPSLN